MKKTKEEKLIEEMIKLLHKWSMFGMDLEESQAWLTKSCKLLKIKD